MRKKAVIFVPNTSWERVRRSLRFPVFGGKVFKDKCSQGDPITGWKPVPLPLPKPQSSGKHCSLLTAHCPPQKSQSSGLKPNSFSSRSQAELGNAPLSAKLSLATIFVPKYNLGTSKKAFENRGSEGDPITGWKPVPLPLPKPQSSGKHCSQLTAPYKTSIIRIKTEQFQLGRFPGRAAPGAGQAGQAHGVEAAGFQVFQDLPGPVHHLLGHPGQFRHLNP